MIKLSRYILLILLFSCSAEKINLSPVGDSFGGSLEKSTYSLAEQKDLILYSSEINDLISTFPKFKNEAVNSEVKNLKIPLKDYLDAIDIHNLKAQKEARTKFEKSYRKLQKLRKFLNSDEDEVLNRYLVRIKTNISLLDNIIPKEASPIS